VANSIAADDLVFDREVKIRKGGQQSRNHLLEPFHGQVGLRTSRDVNDAVLRECLVGHSDIAAIECVDPSALEVRERHGLLLECWWRKPVESERELMAEPSSEPPTLRLKFLSCRRRFVRPTH
jgi:hypothetical protein